MSKKFALLGIYAMAALQILWYALLIPPERIPVGVVLAIALLPIAPAVILAIFRRPSAIFWGGVAALFYFCHSIAELWTTPSLRPLALLELGLSLWIIFTGNWSGLSAKLFKGKQA